MKQESSVKDQTEKKWVNQNRKKQMQPTNKQVKARK